MRRPRVAFASIDLNQDGAKRARSSSMPVSQKTELTDFNLLKRIGKGGFGEVYLCRKRDSTEILALKILDKSYVWQQNKIRSVMNERDVLAQGKYPGLVKLHYSFQDDRYLYLAMEYCPGGDFFHFMENWTMLEIDDAILYMAEMIFAVSTLHKLGYIHRDLKPDNFLIDARGHLKLADFGLSKEGIRDFSASPCFVGQTSQEKTTGKGHSMVGSPDYMSPEVLSTPLEGYGKEVDWWSLGCVFFDIVAGYPPFSGETPMEVFENIGNWKVTLPTAIELARPNFTEQFEEFLLCFLCAPESRVSCLEDIQQHPLFLSLDWENLQNEKPLFVPQLKDGLDTSYFADVITNSSTTPRKAHKMPDFYQYYNAKLYAKQHTNSTPRKQQINTPSCPSSLQKRNYGNDSSSARPSVIQTDLVTPTRDQRPFSESDNQIWGFSYQKPPQSSAKISQTIQRQQIVKKMNFLNFDSNRSVFESDENGLDVCEEDENHNSLATPPLSPFLEKINSQSPKVSIEQRKQLPSLDFDCMEEDD